MDRATFENIEGVLYGNLPRTQAIGSRLAFLLRITTQGSPFGCRATNTYIQGLPYAVDGAADLFGRICNPAAANIRICNPHFRITNANIHCRRIANPTERPQLWNIPPVEEDERTGGTRHERHREGRPLNPFIY